MDKKLPSFMRRPQHSDKEELERFFQMVITDTFNKENISHLIDDQQHELNQKMTYIESDLNNHKPKRYFLIAIDQTSNEIIGSIEYGKANEIIQTLLTTDLSMYPEIGTVFVHPAFKGKGIATDLIEAIINHIKNQGYHGYCLDCGYKQAQQFWMKKLGNPTFVQPNYWDEDNHHMVWKREFD